MTSRVAQEFTRLPKSPYLEFLGLKIEERRKGRIRMSLRVRDQHRSRLGRLHGAVIAGVVEAAGAGAAFSAIYPKAWCLTMQVSMNFLSSIASGKLLAEGKVVHHGSRSLVTDVRITCDGRTIATGTVTSMKFPIDGAETPPSLRPGKGT